MVIQIIGNGFSRQIGHGKALHSFCFIHRHWVYMMWFLTQVQNNKYIKKMKRGSEIKNIGDK